MTFINPINVNTSGIGTSYGYGATSKPEKQETPEAEVGTNAPQNQVSGDKILGLMAQSAASVTPAATSLDPTKYVDGESAARIAGFMSQFEDIVAANLSAISEEFPTMSAGSQQALALAQAEQQG